MPEPMQVSIFSRKAYVEVVATISTREELEKLIAVLEIYKEILRLCSCLEKGEAP